MNTSKKIKSRQSFSRIKLLPIFSAALIMVMGTGYDCHAFEVTEEKVNRKPVKKRSVVVRKRPPYPVLKETDTHQVNKVNNIQPSEVNISEPVQIDEYTVIKQYVPVKREISVRPIAEPLNGRLTREDIHDYIEMLKYGETIDDMEYAARILGSSGMRRYINDPIIDNVYYALIDTFKKNTDEILLKSITLALGRLGKENAGNTLLNYLIHGDNNNVKSVIILSLGNLKYREAIYPLMRILRDGDDYMLRARSAIALGMIGDKSATYALTTALNDEDYSVKREAIEALGKIGSPEATYPLTNILNYDNDLQLREDAARALRKIESATD